MGDYGFIPAQTLSPLALIDPGARAKPDPAQKIAAAFLQATLSGDPIGYGYGNKSVQTDKFSGVIHLAVKAYMDAIGGARVNVLQKKLPSLAVKSQPFFLKAPQGQGNYSRDEEYEPADPDHPLCKIVEQPGGEDGVWSMGQELTYLTLQHMLTGDAPAYTPCNEQGRPVRFYALTSALLTVAYMAGVNPQYPKGAYRIQPYGYAGVYAGGMSLAAGAVLPGEEVPRFREPHPWARNLGYSRLEAHRNEIDVLNAITRSRWNYFDTGLMIKTAMMVPGADKHTIDDLQNTITQKHGGAERANKLLILGGQFEQGKLSVQQLGPPIAEMDYGESYGPAARYVLGVFRVPGVIVGLGDGDGNYSADWAAQRRFYDNGLHPYGRNLSVFATQALARPWSEYHGQYKIEVEVPEPRNVEMDAAELEFAYLNDIITVNEYRRATNRKPIPDGDVTLSVYKAKTQQQFAPQPVPGSLVAGLPSAERPTAGAPPRPENPEAAGSLPPRPVNRLKALVESNGHLKAFDESKHPRDHGKFSEKPGAQGEAKRPKKKPTAPESASKPDPAQPSTEDDAALSAALERLPTERIEALLRSILARRAERVPAKPVPPEEQPTSETPALATQPGGHGRPMFPAVDDPHIDRVPEADVSAILSAVAADPLHAKYDLSHFAEIGHRLGWPLNRLAYALAAARKQGLVRLSSDEGYDGRTDEEQRALLATEPDSHEHYGYATLTPAGKERTK